MWENCRTSIRMDEIFNFFLDFSIFLGFDFSFGHEFGSDAFEDALRLAVREIVDVIVSWRDFNKPVNLRKFLEI